MNRKKIVKVPYGLASSYDNFIEINEKLKGNLKKRILEHELKHDSGNYTIKDLKNDFNSKNSYFFESLRFCAKNPEAFISFFPIMYSYYGKFWTYNLSSFVPFLYLGSIFTIFYYITLKINPFLLIFYWFILVFLLNVFFLLYTHFFVRKQFNHP